MQITIEVPDRLGEQLQQLGDRLPEALIHALQELTATETTEYQDDRQIVELLASQPSPEVVLAIRPSPALQARMSELLAQNKSGTLTRSEEVELDRYMLLEHWVRLAKAHVYSRDRNKDARAVISDRRFLENDIEANKTIESSAIDFDSITRGI
jgi:16S rRNA C1402 (ribose-2'-O) methylase RsmI